MGSDMEVDSVVPGDSSKYSYQNDYLCLWLRPSADDTVDGELSYLDQIPQSDVGVTS